MQRPILLLHSCTSLRSSRQSALIIEAHPLCLLGWGAQKRYSTVDSICSRRSKVNPLLGPWLWQCHHHLSFNFYFCATLLFCVEFGWDYPRFQQSDLGPTSSFLADSSKITLACCNHFRCFEARPSWSPMPNHSYCCAFPIQFECFAALFWFCGDSASWLYSWQHTLFTLGQMNDASKYWLREFSGRWKARSTQIGVDRRSFT